MGECDRIEEMLLNGGLPIRGDGCPIVGLWFMVLYWLDWQAKNIHVFQERSVIFILDNAKGGANLKGVF